MEEEEYARKESQFLGLVKRHRMIIFIPPFLILILGFGAPFIIWQHPDGLLEDNFKTCLNNLYLLSGWFSSWSIFITLCVAVIGGIFAAQQLNITYDQLHLAYQQLVVSNRNQKMQDALNLFNEIKKVERLKATSKLYEVFCHEGRFRLDIAHTEGVVLKGVKVRDIEYIIHTYEQMGAFAQEGLIDGKAVANLITGACVRMWIILEEYVQRERERRYYPRLFARFEYLAGLCIQDILAHEPKKIAIYHPKDSRYSQPYDETILRPILDRVVFDLDKLGLPLPNSSTNLSQPHSFTHIESVQNGYKSQTPKYASEHLSPSETQQ
jgi:hypothetical protein